MHINHIVNEYFQSNHISFECFFQNDIFCFIHRSASGSAGFQSTTFVELPYILINCSYLLLHSEAKRCPTLSENGESTLNQLRLLLLNLPMWFTLSTSVAHPPNKKQRDGNSMRRGTSSGPFFRHQKTFMAPSFVSCSLSYPPLSFSFSNFCHELFILTSIHFSIHLLIHVPIISEFYLNKGDTVTSEGGNVPAKPKNAPNPIPHLSSGEPAGIKGPKPQFSETRRHPAAPAW